MPLTLHNKYDDCFWETLLDRSRSRVDVAQSNMPSCGTVSDSGDWG